ncbi:MAG: HAD hydrolase family protein [Micropruina sp.]|nr:HAD hydrolase family protein [Micropruina sp.]
MTRPRLIVTDLDGTFLNATGGISAVNAAAVARAAECDVPFVVATGRPSRWLGELAELDFLPLVIVSNGAGVFDLSTNSYVRTHPIEAALALDVVRLLRQAIPGLTFGVEMGPVFGREHATPSGEEGSPWTVTATIEELVGAHAPPLKLLGFHTELDSDALAGIAKPLVGELLEVTHSLSSVFQGLVEISAPGITKASALAHLCAELGIAASEVAAFGDMPNDITMLEWAGMPFVVANAHPTMLDGRYPVIGHHDEDGVGRAILELLG